MFHVDAVRVNGFFDVYNLLNTNAEQTLSTSSRSVGPITGPRVLRIGAPLEW